MMMMMMMNLQHYGAIQICVLL